MVSSNEQQVKNSGGNGDLIAVLTKTFLLPGDLVSNALGANESDDRGMIRTLINMLFWNLIAAFVAIVVM